MGTVEKEIFILGCAGVESGEGVRCEDSGALGVLRAQSGLLV